MSGDAVVQHDVSAGAAALVARFGAARRDPGKVVVEGFHALKHALRFGARLEIAVSCDPEAADRLAARLAPDLVPVLPRLLAPIPPEVMAELAPLPPTGGLIAIAHRPHADVSALLASRGEAPIVLLDRPRHLGNLGAVVRVAAAAGAEGVLALGPHDPWHPAAVRGGAGLQFAIPVARIGRLPLVSRPLIAFDPAGGPLGRSSLPPAAVLMFGSERAGLEAGLLGRATRVVAIPMRAGVSSLNLATAVAVALYAGCGPPRP